jgi:hypothetical protein
MRLPLAWESQFVTLYNTAVDQFLTYVQSQFPRGSNIVMLKQAGVVSNDLEIQMPGQTVNITIPADPGPTTVGPLLNCSNTIPGATVWLNAYNLNPVNNQTFATANEVAFGQIIGHLWGTLANLGLSKTILSIATVNNTAYPAVDCGVNGTSTCSVKTAAAGNYSLYYFEHYVADLFNGGLSYTEAQAAYTAIRSDTFSLAPAQFSINSTALAQPPPVSLQQTSCALNNTLPADAPTITLDAHKYTFIGPGTVVGWQTATNQGPECSSNAYYKVLENGVNDGGLYLEVEPDAAFTNLSQCGSYLTTALQQLLAKSPPVECSY